MKIAVVLLLMAASLAWALHGMDTRAVLSAMGGVDLGQQALVLLYFTFTHALRVFRLNALLGTRIRFWRMWNLISIGFLAIHTVPLRMGELVRPYLLAEREGIAFGRALAAIFVERLLDMLSLVVMLLMCAFLVDLPPMRIEGVDILSVGQRAFGAALAVGVVAGGAIVVVGEPVLRWTDRLPAGGFVRRFREGLVSLLGRPVEAVQALAITALAWLFTVLAVQAGLRSFDGLPTTLGEALAVWSATSTGMTAVPTPGFVGALEAFCSGALRLLGADADSARAYAIVLHATMFGFTALTGGLALVIEGVSLGNLVTKSRSGGTGGLDTSR